MGRLLVPIRQCACGLQNCLSLRVFKTADNTLQSFAVYNLEGTDGFYLMLNLTEMKQLVCNSLDFTLFILRFSFQY